MTAGRTLLSTWQGTYLLDGSRVLRSEAAPSDPDALAERIRLRLAGALTPEEETLLRDRGAEPWRSRDRRLVRAGVLYDPSAQGAVEPSGASEAHREALLREAERGLRASWDPSVHVEEAVRSLRDLDRAANLLGERLASWASTDAPELEGVDPPAAARRLLERSEPRPLGPEDPAVDRARRQLAELVLALHGARAVIETALASSVPRRAPNLHLLLGPELAARLVAQAGGLDRLARLPAGTIQVLGAERAFFEHLRGRAPPPRHGLLFLHPSIQTAPRAQRGKLARALAAKVAIAARLDRAGRGEDPQLKQQFERRRDAIRSARPSARPRARGARTLRPPLDRAAEHG